MCNNLLKYNFLIIFFINFIKITLIKKKIYFKNFTYNGTDKLNIDF